MARLASGIRKRPDGTLEKRFTIDGRRLSVYGKTSKEIAEKEHDLRNKVARGLYTENRNITLDAYYKEWQEAKRNNTKPSSLRIYNTHFKNHISPELGAKKIQKIERREVLALQTKLKAKPKSRNSEEKLSPATINKVMQVLCTILNDAMNDEIITRNPALNIKGIKKQNGEKPAVETFHSALTEEEQADFMAAVRDEYYYECIALLLLTGMREGEAAALTWGDIDYAKSIIHVTETLAYDEDSKTYVGPAKTGAGQRDIPMNDNIRSILKAQKKKMMEFHSFSAVVSQEKVFISPRGCVVRDAAINAAIKKGLEKLEEEGKHIEHFTAHALRDTFATRYIEQGGKPQTLKTILGHTSLAMTMDLYSHVMPNTKQDEMNSISIVI